jgi:hypothetical protein
VGLGDDLSSPDLIAIIMRGEDFMELKEPMIFVAVAVMLAFLLLAGRMAQADTTVVVNLDNMDAWRFLVTSGDGVGEFVEGPNTPPMGPGSLRLSSGTHGYLSAQLRHQGFHGTRLIDLTALHYRIFAT